MGTEPALEDVTDGLNTERPKESERAGKRVSCHGLRNEESPFAPEIIRSGVKREIVKQVLRKKLSKLRHLVVREAVHPEYLDSLFPSLLENFHPQTVTYNGGVANIREWKISCYLEVMEGGVPCTEPNLQLLKLFQPLLQSCNDMFVAWYKQQHSIKADIGVSRLMTFITRYTPAPGEQALLKHVDGAGKVDGSLVVALPVDRWSASEEINAFHGGGLTFWDGKDRSTRKPQEIHYDTRSGDVAFIDRAVWHQADPITKGTRWALVVFYKIDQENMSSVCKYVGASIRMPHAAA